VDVYDRSFIDRWTCILLLARRLKMNPEVEQKFALLNKRLDLERAERKQWHEERIRYTVIFGTLSLLLSWAYYSRQ